MNIDKILIGEILNEQNVGLYEAAVRISSVGYFIPVAIVNSYQPAITKAFSTNKKDYWNKLENIFYFLMGVALLMALPIAFFSELIISFLFGTEYLATIPVLQVHAFSMIFVFLGVGRGLWNITESYFKFLMISTILGAITNIFLNSLLLPRFGIIGAAYATMISYFVMYIGTGLFYGPAKGVAFVQLRALTIISVVRKLGRWSR